MSRAAGRTSNRGTCARRRVPVAMLPSTRRAKPLRPCVAMTIRLAFSSAAIRAIATDGSPNSARTRTCLTVDRSRSATSLR
jgi:hypothetical protein